VCLKCHGGGDNDDNACFMRCMRRGKSEFSDRFVEVSGIDVTLFPLSIDD
jgi:hypothetical protein